MIRARTAGTKIPTAKFFTVGVIKDSSDGSPAAERLVLRLLPDDIPDIDPEPLEDTPDDNPDPLDTDPDDIPEVVPDVVPVDEPCDADLDEPEPVDDELFITTSIM